ncbi:MAG: hypothetical protein JXA78_08995 [Anaerolineales bacterium]|nr:hypothetical protein [Anaerolineales bacterium]
MDKASANPLLVSLFFVARCLVPLVIMLGFSYLLKRLGLVAEAPKPPPDYEEGNGDRNQNNEEGGPTHANA